MSLSWEGWARDTVWTRKSIAFVHLLSSFLFLLWIIFVFQLFRCLALWSNASPWKRSWRLIERFSMLHVDILTVGYLTAFSCSKMIGSIRIPSFLGCISLCSCKNAGVDRPELRVQNSWCQGHDREFFYNLLNREFFLHALIVRNHIHRCPGMPRPEMVTLRWYVW